MGKFVGTPEHEVVNQVAQFDGALKSFSLNPRGDSYKLELTVDLPFGDQLLKLTDYSQRILTITVARKKKT